MGRSPWARARIGRSGPPPGGRPPATAPIIRGASIVVQTSHRGGHPEARAGIVASVSRCRDRGLPDQRRLPCPCPTLPEARCSVNVRLVVHGHDVQVTLRGDEETEVMGRLEAILAQYPAPQPTAPPAASPGPGDTPQCKYHGAMKASTKAPGTFYCTKKLADGSYCPSRFPAQDR